MSNDPKLATVRPEFRAKLEPILDQLEAEGFQPKISNALRTKEQQLEKVRLGYAMPGATDPGTHGWGLAADVIDKRYGWPSPKQKEKFKAAAIFFARLCDLVTGAGMTSGGTWFGKGGRANPTHRSVWNVHGLGWDPAHIEVRDIPKELRREFHPETT